MVHLVNPLGCCRGRIQDGLALFLKQYNTDKLRQNYANANYEFRFQTHP